MRRLIRSTGIAAAGFVLAVGVAGASDRDEQSPESRAYFSLSFGGAKIAPRDLHYGLRIDHDSRFLEGTAAPLMQFDFTRSGLSDARLNGLSVLKQKYRLHQSEEQAAEEAGAEAPAEEAPAAEAPAEEAPAEGGGEAAAAEGAAEEGFFSSTWNGVTGFFGGLFGGEDEAEVAETATQAPAETADAGAEAPPEDLAEGTFMSYGMVDWGLLALGAAGIGLAASEVSGGDESPKLLDSDGDGISDGQDPPGTPGVPCIIPPNQLDPDGTPNGCDPNAFTGRQSGYRSLGADPEYQKWLDSGTGHMGDLGG